jgi:GT2 family glycosyltransferase
MISIVIPTWNTAQVTQRCLLSIFKFLPSGSFDVIVVDNGSTDNTKKLLSKFKINYIKNTKNLGFARACNQGAAKSKGDYLLFLNSDMVLLDDSLLLLASYLASHPDVAVIGPKFLNPDLSPQASVFPPQTPLNALKEFYLGQKSYSKYLPSSSHPTPVFAVSGGAFMTTAAYFKQLGGWNEKFFFYYEDLDLCRTAHLQNFKVVFHPKALVIHHHGVSGRSLADYGNQWRRLVASSIKYHGKFEHYLLFFITWTSQKWARLFPKSR